MTNNEVHELIDALAWEDVGAVAEKDAIVKKHIHECDICLERERKVDEGRLASMGAQKRRLMLRTAERIAGVFKEQHRA